MSILRIEKYGDQYRLLKMPSRAKKERMFSDNPERSTPDERFPNNVARARSKVLEYGYCNKWEYFCTLTLDGSLRDRYDLPEFVKALGRWISRYNRKYRCSLKYLLIPEQHKDGAYHMHGLLSGVSPDSLERNEYGYLDLPFYRLQFGYISLSKLKDKDKAVSYITKYISKGFAQTEIESGKHLYYVSKKLDTKLLLFESYILDTFPMDFENEYCGISWRGNYFNLDDFYFEILKNGDDETENGK